jgi:hypothetical protein
MQSLSQLQKLRTKLKRQMHEAFSTAHFQNQHFWNALLGPAPIVAMPKPPNYEPGDVHQVKLWALQSAMLWRDHHAFVREHRSAHPDFVREKPQPRFKWMLNYP